MDDYILTLKLMETDSVSSLYIQLKPDMKI